MTQLEIETAKYRLMWEGERYRYKSPGMRHVAQFLHSAAREKGDTLIDLGCGTGRCGEFFSRYGLKVVLFDLVDAVEVDLPFVQGNMWDLFAVPEFDWIFCSDVLEHIPPEFVDQTLDGMAHITRKGGLIAMCHLDSSMREFGLDDDTALHLSVHPRQWWQDKIEQRWELKEYQTDWKETSFFVGPKKMTGGGRVPGVVPAVFPPGVPH